MGEFAVSIERSKAKSVSASGGAARPWPPDQGLCPWTPLGALPPDPRYKFALYALAMAPPLPNPKYATGSIAWRKLPVDNLLKVYNEKMPKSPKRSIDTGIW